MLKNKYLISSKVLSQSSKVLSFISLHKYHKRHHLPHNSTPSIVGNPPTSIQINYSSRHNPRQPKSTKENTANGISNLTMKKMVHGLHILFTHATPINHNGVPLPEIVHGKILLPFSLLILDMNHHYNIDDPSHIVFIVLCVDENHTPFHCF